MDKEVCGIDLYPEEPGHYICLEFKDPKFPHHMECHQHHTEGADCELVRRMREIDDQLLSYAN